MREVIARELRVRNLQPGTVHTTIAALPFPYVLTTAARETEAVPKSVFCLSGPAFSVSLPMERLRPTLACDAHPDQPGNPAAPASGNLKDMTSNILILLAEGVGFEPTGHLRGRRFSRPLL